MNKQREFLKNKFESNQLAHAYLLSGQDVNSIKAFAKDFVKFINCLTRDVKQNSCGSCYPCAAIKKEGYPDLLVVKKDEEKKEITILKIREAQKFLSLKSYYEGYKVLIIKEAEKMNQEAQSCFLKTLEEPKGKTLILMISEKPDLLLPTILSRCQLIRFWDAKSNAENASDALKELLPVIHSDLAEKFKYTKKINLEGDNFNRIIDVMQSYFRKMMLLKIGVGGEGGLPERWQTSANGRKDYSIEKIKKILRLVNLVSFRNLKGNINQKLALEIILLEI